MSNTGLFDHIFSPLPDGWTLEPLQEVVDFQEGPGILAKDFYESGVPLLRLSSIAGPFTTFDGCNYLAPNKVEKKWNHFKLFEGDILLSTSGSLGRVSEVSKLQSGCICYTGIIRFRPKENFLRKSYIKYFLQSKLFEQQAQACAAGSVLKHFGPTHLKTMSIPVPPADYQIFIEKCISPIDNKIQTNTQTNQTLESIAQAIFKSWFVDFEPVKAKISVLAEGGTREHAELAAMGAISGKSEAELAQLQQQNPEYYQQLAETAVLFPSAMVDSKLGEIPEGWGVQDIDNVTSLIIDHRGKTPKKLGGDWVDFGYPALSAKNIKQGRIVSQENIRFLNDEIYSKWMKEEVQQGDILLTSEAPMGEMLFLTDEKKYCLSQRLYALRANSRDITPSYLYLWLQTSAAQSDLNGRATGTTVVGIRQSELRKVHVLVPGIKLSNSLENLVFPLFKQLHELESQNITLEKLRGSLLPKLLSGEIDLTEIRSEVA